MIGLIGREWYRRTDVVRRDRSNLAMARHQLRRVEADLDV